jgi:uncharacterized protein
MAGLQEPPPGYGIRRLDIVRRVDSRTVGRVSTITRYPVKSLVGEALESAAVTDRGIEGDRLWAVRDADGKLGSGKSSRRFRRMPGLLDLTARYVADSTPVVTFPDGRELTAEDSAIHDALSGHVGRPVTLAREAEVSHFDECALHLVTTRSLARLGELHGAEVDPRHFRANLVVDDGDQPRFDEDEWVGRELTVGPELVIHVRRPMPRCVMVTLPQVGLPADRGLLDSVTRVNDMALGLVLDVVTPGTIRLDDLVRVV